MSGIIYGYKYRKKKTLGEGIFLMPHGKYVIRVKKKNSASAPYFTSIAQKDTKIEAENFLKEYNKNNSL